MIRDLSEETATVKKCDENDETHVIYFTAEWEITMNNNEDEEDEKIYPKNIMQIYLMSYYNKIFFWLSATSHFSSGFHCVFVTMPVNDFTVLRFFMQKQNSNARAQALKTN